MNGAAITLLVLAALSALANWVAVGTGQRRVEVIAKPLTMVLLIGMALVIDAHTEAIRAWFIVALVLSLAGDVFLMLKRDMFIAGLASFLLAHIAYIVGMALAGLSAVAAFFGFVVALLAAAVIGRRIHRAAAAVDSRLAMPVASYITVISAMFVTAAATTNFVAIRGAIFFYASDAVLGWNRFVRPVKNGRIATMVTYHFAQAILVLALQSL